MSLFHLYTAYAIVPTQTLRAGARRASCCSCRFLIFPVARRFRHRIMWWDWLAAALADRDRRLRDRRAATTSPTATPRPTTGTSSSASALIAAGARGDAAHHRLDHAGRHHRASSLYALFGAVAAGAVDAQGLRGRPPGRRDLYMTLEGIFGVAVDVVLVADHPVHHLRRLPAVLGRRQVLSSTSRSRRWAASRPAPAAPWCWRRSCSAARRARGVATTVTLGAVAYPMLEKVGYEQERRRRPARGRRPGRHHLAAGARRRRLPDRRVPEDLVPRRAADGGDPDAACSTSRCS